MKHKLTMQEKADALKKRVSELEKERLECISRGHESGAKWCENEIKGINDFLSVYRSCGLIV